MSDLIIFDLRNDEPPPTNDWSQLKITLYKNPSDQSRYPSLNAVVRLRDAHGRGLGIVGPLASGFDIQGGLEWYPALTDASQDPHGVTSSQSVARRGWRAEEAEISRLRSLYTWHEDRNLPPSITKLRDALYLKVKQNHWQSDVQQAAQSAEPWEELQRRLPAMDSDPSRVQCCRNRNTAYTHLLLFRRMLLHSIPPKEADPLVFSHARTEERELLGQLKEMRKEEARLHILSILSLCQTEHSPCQLRGHVSDMDCTACRESVWSLESVDLLTELGLSAAS